MITFQNLTSAEYEDLRFTLIEQTEGAEFGVYVDSAAAGNPTVGYGFNLRDQQVRDAVLNVILGLTVNPGTLTNPQRAAELVYRQQIEDAINRFNADLDHNGTVTDAERTTSAGQLQGDLDRVMAQRAADPLLQGIVTHSSFAFLSTAEMRTPFDASVQTYETRVNGWLAGIPQSKERAVLFSLAYNGALASSTSLRAAIQNNNRAEAWFEIRYNSNKNALAQNPPADAGGVAKRRYYESQVFGLYDPGVDEFTIDEVAAKQVYRMYTQHRAQILQYESLYGSGAATSRIDTANNDYQLIGTPYQVQTLEASFQPAYQYLMTYYVSTLAPSASSTRASRSTTATSRSARTNRSRHSRRRGAMTPATPASTSAPAPRRTTSSWARGAAISSTAAGATTCSGAAPATISCTGARATTTSSPGRAPIGCTAGRGLTPTSICPAMGPR